MKKILIKKEDIYLLVCSVFFSVFILIGRSYQISNSCNAVFKNPIYSFIKFIALIGVLYFILKTAKTLIKKYETLEIKIKNDKLNNLFNNHTFITSLIMICTGWLIYIIAFYPTIMTIDAYNQLKQYFNIENYYSDTVNLLSKDVLLTNHHPVLHTIMMGGLLDFGKSLGNERIGIFFYTLLQVMILAATLAYSIKYLKDNGIKNRFLYLILLIYIIVPTFPFFAITATKDTIYTALIILYIIQIHKFINYAQKRKISIKEMIILIILMTLIWLMRNNGIHVMIASFLPVIFYSKENMKRCFSIFIIMMILNTSYNKLLLPSLNITAASGRETLSIPFQQTARYIKYYENDITIEEKEIINHVLHYDIIKNLYTPQNADPVKGTYKKSATDEDVNRYFQVWKMQYSRHPWLYWDSVINDNYGYFYPQLSKSYIYYQDITQPIFRKIANFGYSNYKENFVDCSFNNLEKLRESLVNYAKTFQYIPVAGLLVNVAINNWVLIILLAYCISTKQKNKILILLPGLLTIIVCIISPLDNCFRYAMPTIFSNPLVLLLIINKKNKFNEEVINDLNRKK